MQQFIFNLQAKGGAGKSMLTYLQGLQQQDNNRAYFIDCDSSVKSSLLQLKFLQGKAPARFGLMSLLDERDKIDRQLLFENLQMLSTKDYDTFYLDFGAPESDQLPNLFSKDYSTSEFKQIETELNAKFCFNIIVAGGGAYEGCTAYLKRVSELLNGQFEVNIYANEYSFLNFPDLINELQLYTALKKDKIKAIKFFGDFDITTSPHKKILSYVQQGLGMEVYTFIERIKINKELNKL